MLPSNPLVMAVLLVLIGCAFYLTVIFLRKSAPRVRPEALEAVSIGGGDLVPDHGDAVMMVEVGGHIKTINDRARLIFHLQENETPNLERLARKVRPAETLLKLCAAEGQARFVLDGRLVEGTSYIVANGGSSTMVVSLRYTEISSGISGERRGPSADTLETFTLLTQAMAASLDLDETLQAVLENVEKLVPADFMEVTVWDSTGEYFVPYRFAGLPGPDRKLQMANERYHLDQGLTGQLEKDRKPLLIGDIEAREDLQPALEKMPVHVRAYLGLPLLVSGDLIGTLELGSMQVDAFNDQDLDLLRLLSGQAAIAIHNALLFSTQQQRTAELSGLARLAQAFSSVRDPATMFARLVESIAPLLDVEIIGFLLYNENSRLLEARQPFHGLPDPIVDLYRARVQPGSTAERFLLDQDMLISEDASADEKWAVLGMEQIAQAASLRETVLVPLAAGGHMIGYLQASNHTKGSTPFTKAELHLLMIVANQTASIIENATLVQQSRQRAQRAEALRRITSLASSSASQDEIFQFSLQELARLLRAPVAALMLYNKEQGDLRLHRASLFGVSEEQADRVPAITVDDPQFHFTVAGSQHPLSVETISNTNRAIVPFYQTVFSAWDLESVIIVPMISRNEGIGELLLGSREAESFEQGDIQVVATAAGNLAVVAEQSFLLGQTDESLRRRVDQLTAITRISRELSTSLDLNYLMNLVYDESLRTTRADCGTILLFNLDGGEASAPSVRFFVGDMPNAELTPLERLVIQRDAPQSVPDFSRSQFDPPHPGVHSTLIVPISTQRRTAGLISLHGKSPAQFDETTLEILQSLAVQAAVALNNALAYEEQTRRGALLKRELETLSRLIQVSRLTKPSQSLAESLEAIAGAIRSATPFQAVVISIYDAENDVLRRAVGAGIQPEVWAELQSRTQPWSGIRQLLLPKYEVGEVFYIPHDDNPALPVDVHTVSVMPSLYDYKLDDSWHKDDMLLIPLYDGLGSPLGMISVDAPSDNRRPDRPTYEALEVFAAQAGMIIDSYQRVGRLERQVDGLCAEKTRLEQAAVQAQANLPSMLHKEMEQSIALRGLHQRIERIRAGLEIAAEANRQESEGGILRKLAAEMLTHFAMQVALVAERGPAGIRLIEVVGSFPSGANPDALFGQRNPLRHLLQQNNNREDGLVLVANIENAPDWQNNTLLNALEARSIIGLPLDMGDGRTAGVLAVGQRALPTFLDEDRRVFAQLAHQVSVGLQNLQLLTQTRRRLQEVNLLLDFSRKLGTLATADILDVLVQSVARVLPQAHCGWVGMWEEKEQALVPQAAYGYQSQPDILAICYAVPAAGGEAAEIPAVLAERVFRTGRAERAAELNFGKHYQLSAGDLLHYRKATGGRLPVSGMVVPLRMAENVLGVVFFENFDTPDAFSAEDEALVSSFTRQAAMALENARLYQASERRASQMQALTAVAGTITSNLQRDVLVASLLENLERVVPYNTATLWLRTGDSLAVSAAAGFADNESRINISVAVEDSELFKSMIQTGKPIVVNDLRSDPRFPSLIEPEFLSWLGIPLMYKAEVTGLIALEKREADFYTSDSIQAATAFASQAAVSLENARLYEDSTRRASELDERSQRLALLNLLSGELVASLDIDYIFQFTSQQLRGVLDADGVAAVMIDPAGGYVVQAETPAREDAALALTSAPLFERLLDSHGIFQSSSVEDERDLTGLQEAFLQPRGVRSLLVVPLAAGAVIQGWFLVYGKNEHRYGPSEIELARTMCNQTAIAVQNARLFAETRRLTADLERRVEERTHELSREHQNSQTLLHIITELSTSLDMGLVLNRTLNVLNDSIGSEESLIILSQPGASPYRAGMPLARLSDGRAAIEQQIARWVISSRKPVLVHKVQEDGRWEFKPESAAAYQSVMAVPLVMGEEVLGTLLLFHRGANYFSQSQLGLMEATARQIGIALNNAELFNLIRDQSEHLGSMLRDQQIEASRSRAILEAVADGVLVTDANSKVTLFNISAERILGLTAPQVIGNSLDHFSGMFGKAASDWMQTIRTWPRSISEDADVETYAEQLTLDNGRIVDVHLAPVFWRQDFLGTVSIFRDITHEVQVDRLKSEFVANVSHELRTPMTSIKGYVEIMLMGAAGELSPQQDRFLRIVKSNTERLGILVNDLLEISRIEAGRVSLSLQPLDVREIAQEVIAEAERRAREDDRPMAFTVNAQPRLPFAQGDKERIRQVLASLVSNGYNYTPDGGCVSVAIREVDQSIQIDVHDTGIGIQPDAQHRIFERFYRGEDPLVLASSGTGLGLAISKTLIEMHNGRVWFDSSGVRGEGSTFSFTLPVSESIE